MRRLSRVGTVAAVISISFILGFLVAQHEETLVKYYQKPVFTLGSGLSFVVGPDTPIIKEEAYTRCRHILTSGFENRAKLVGLSLKELRELMPPEEGYLIWCAEDGSLVIHQRIEGWCPVDKDKVHLGVFEGKVAMFRGPSGIDDEVIRITEVKVDDLPENMRKAVVSGVLEYKGEEEAAYVLDNLDEYE